MWSAIANISKDLKEFANVVSHDTKRIAEGAGLVDSEVAFAGDDRTAEATLFALDDSTLIKFQRSDETYSVSLSASELEERARLPDAELLLSSENIQRLLDESDAVFEMYERLCRDFDESHSPLRKEKKDQKEASFTDKDGGDDAEDAPKSPQTSEVEVSRDDFFERYFVRLRALRLAESKRKQAERDEASTRRKADNPEDEDEAWGVLDDAAPSTTKHVDPASTGTVANPPSESSNSDAHQQQLAAKDRRIHELEALVGSLNAQVRHLQEVNSSLALKVSQLQRDQSSSVAVTPLPSSVVAVTPLPAEKQRASPSKDEASPWANADADEARSPSTATTVMTSQTDAGTSPVPLPPTKAEEKTDPKKSKEPTTNQQAVSADRGGGGKSVSAPSGDLELDDEWAELE